MFTIQIQDEEFARRLQQIAERENRSVEAVIKTMVERYALAESAPSEPYDSTESVKRIRRKAYAKARRYWESVGDAAKAALTDDELDEQFGVFDEEGIPRLKSELVGWEPAPGTGPYIARVARESNIT